MTSLEENVKSKPKVNIADLFNNATSKKTYLKVCAPMVRYSKLEFRSLVRRYGVDLTFTPMIITDWFCRSDEARLKDFTTNLNDSPLIAQFAAKNVQGFISASEMIYPYVDGVDLNCECPQRWAMIAGCGGALLKKPDIIKDIILGIRRHLPSSFSISAKLRLLEEKSLESTIELCRQLEKCGATFLTIHGRTCQQKLNEPVNKMAISEIKKSLQIPIVANGDVMSLADANSLFKTTNCNGVMAARGMLGNPGLFAGFEETPLACIQDWLDIGYQAKDQISFQSFHHNLTFMTEKLMKKSSRIAFNSLTNKQDVYDFIDDYFGIRSKNVIPDYLDDAKIDCCYDDTKYRDQNSRNESFYRDDLTDGKYFLDKININKRTSIDDCGLDFMDNNLFQ